MLHQIIKHPTEGTKIVTAAEAATTYITWAQVGEPGQADSLTRQLQRESTQAARRRLSAEHREMYQGLDKG